MTALAPHLSAFLRDHLSRERNVSHHTVAAYATCFALLVRFAADRLKHRPSDLTIEEIDLDLISAFLLHTESERGNSARTRNGRLAAIRAMLNTVCQPASIWHSGFVPCRASALTSP
jgi:site-specific recombinase XerC